MIIVWLKSILLTKSCNQRPDFWFDVRQTIVNQSSIDGRLTIDWLVDWRSIRCWCMYLALWPYCMYPCTHVHMYMENRLSTWSSNHCLGCLWALTGFNDLRWHVQSHEGALERSDNQIVQNLDIDICVYIYLDSCQMMNRRCHSALWQVQPCGTSNLPKIMNFGVYDPLHGHNFHKL